MSLYLWLAIGAGIVFVILAALCVETFNDMED